MICYLLSSLLNNFITSPPFISSKYRCSPQQILHKLLDGYRSPSTLHTSCTNFVNQKFKERAFISVMHVSKLSTVSKSTWTPLLPRSHILSFSNFATPWKFSPLISYGVSLISAHSWPNNLLPHASFSVVEILALIELVSSKTTATSLQALENASAWFKPGSHLS